MDWEKQTAESLTRSVFDRNKTICVPNVMSGTVPGFEADLLVLRYSGWAEEVEFKRTASDFRNEFRNKLKKHKTLANTSNHYCKKFWLAAPKDVLVKIWEEIPVHMGIILLESKPRVVHEAPVLECKKFPEEEKEKILRNIYFRYWDLLKKG